MIDLLAGPFGPLIIFCLRVVDVSLGTTRFLLMTRGARLPVALLGFVEVLIWVTAAGAAIQNLTSPLHVVGYAAGFAAGTWVGIGIEAKLALGTSTVQAFSKGGDGGVAAAVRALGVGVTETEGEGLEGPVEIVSTVVRRQAVPRVIETIEASDPSAFITVYDARVRGGRFPELRRK